MAHQLPALPYAKDSLTPVISAETIEYHYGKHHQAYVANLNNWLVKNADGSIEIFNTANAGTPLTSGKKALLTVDVWEHAYYIDYRNARPKYQETIWDKINWQFAEANQAA